MPEKINFWKFLTLLTFAWVVINTLYLNSIYTTINSMQIPVSSTAQFNITIRSPFTGYFLLISSPLIVNAILAVVAVVILLLYRKL